LQVALNNHLYQNALAYTNNTKSKWSKHSKVTNKKQEINNMELNNMSSLLEEFLEDMTKVLRPLQAGNAYLDRFNIKPGTHLAVRFTNALPIPMLTFRSKTWKPRTDFLPTYMQKSGPLRKIQELYDGGMCLFHHGVYLGNGWVIGHPEGLSRLEDFSHGQVIFEVHYKNGVALPHLQRVKRAIQIAVQSVLLRFNKTTINNNKNFAMTGSQYSIRRRNCEHFVTFIVTGISESTQASILLSKWTPLAVTGMAYKKYS
jgi:hypothetical protein